MRAIVRAMPDLVFFKDPDGAYLGVNARTEAFYGRPEAEIVGRRDADFLPAGARGPVPGDRPAGHRGRAARS